MKKFNVGDKATAALVLRLGLAFAFAYAGISSLRTPAAWESFLPSLLTDHFRADVLLKFFAISELILAAWLLIGKYTRYAAGVSALMLAGVIVANPHALDITFRDVSLVFAAVALALLDSK